MADLNTNDQVEQALAILSSGEDAGSAAASPEDKILEILDAGDGAPAQAEGETEADTTPEKVEPATPAEGKTEAATDPAIEPPGS